MTATIWVSVSQRAKESDLNPSTIWRHIQSGLLPRPVRLSAGTSRFARYELNAIDHARLVGAGDDEIKKLVRELVADRQQVAA